MQGGILNEPVREQAEKLMKMFGEQLGFHFTNLVFVAVTEEGVFRTANCSKEFPLNAEAVRLVAKHLTDWANTLEE